MPPKRKKRSGGPGRASQAAAALAKQAETPTTTVSSTSDGPNDHQEQPGPMSLGAAPAPGGAAEEQRLPQSRALEVLTAPGADLWLQNKRWDDNCSDILASLIKLLQTHCPPPKPAPPARIGTAFQRWRRKFPEHVQDVCGASTRCIKCTSAQPNKNGSAAPAASSTPAPASTASSSSDASNVSQEASSSSSSSSSASASANARASTPLSPSSSSSVPAPPSLETKPTFLRPTSIREAKEKVWCEGCAGVIQYLIGGSGTVWYCSKECMIADREKGDHAHFCNVAQAVLRLREHVIALQERKKNRLQAQQSVRNEWHQCDPMLRAALYQGRIKGAGLPAFIALGDLWETVTQDVFGSCDTDRCASVAHHFAVLFGVHNMNDFALEELRRALLIEEEIHGVDSKKACHTRLTMANTQVALRMFEHAALEFTAVLGYRFPERIFDDDLSIRESRANLAMTELILTWRLHRKHGIPVEGIDELLLKPDEPRKGRREKEHAPDLINLCKRLAMSDAPPLNTIRPTKQDMADAMRHAKGRDRERQLQRERSLQHQQQHAATTATTATATAAATTTTTGTVATTAATTTTVATTTTTTATPTTPSPDSPANDEAANL